MALTAPPVHQYLPDLHGFTLRSSQSVVQTFDDAVNDRSCVCIYQASDATWHLESPAGLAESTADLFKTILKGFVESEISGPQATTGDLAHRLAAGLAKDPAELEYIELETEGEGSTQDGQIAQSDTIVDVSQTMAVQIDVEDKVIWTLENSDTAIRDLLSEPNLAELSTLFSCKLLLNHVQNGVAVVGHVDDELTAAICQKLEQIDLFTRELHRPLIVHQIQPEAEKDYKLTFPTLGGLPANTLRRTIVGYGSEWRKDLPKTRVCRMAKYNLSEREYLVVEIKGGLDSRESPWGYLYQDKIRIKTLGNQSKAFPDTPCRPQPLQGGMAMPQGNARTVQQWIDAVVPPTQSSLDHAVTQLSLQPETDSPRAIPQGVVGKAPIRSQDVYSAPSQAVTSTSSQITDIAPRLRVQNQELEVRSSALQVRPKNPPVRTSYVPPHMRRQGHVSEHQVSYIKSSASNSAGNNEQLKGKAGKSTEKKHDQLLDISDTESIGAPEHASGHLQDLLTGDHLAPDLLSPVLNPRPPSSAPVSTPLLPTKSISQNHSSAHVTDRTRSTNKEEAPKKHKTMGQQKPPKKGMGKQREWLRQVAQSSAYGTGVRNQIPARPVLPAISLPAPAPSRPSVRDDDMSKLNETATRLLEHARMVRGKLKLEVQLTVNLLWMTSRDDKVFAKDQHSCEEAEEYLNGQSENGSMKSDATKMLTTSQRDMAYLIGIKDRNKQHVFVQEPHTTEITYQLVCQTGDSAFTIVEIDESGEPRVKEPPQAIGQIFWHFAKRIYDARVLVSGEHLSAFQDDPNFVELIDNFRIQASKQGSALPVVETRVSAKYFRLHHVFIKRRLVFQLNTAQYKGSMLEVTEVHDLVIEKNAQVGAFRAFAVEPEKMAADSRMWYEASLIPKTRPPQLDASLDLGIGLKADWDPTDVLAQWPLREQRELTALLVARMDKVGLNNQGPWGEVVEAPTANQPWKTWW